MDNTWGCELSFLTVTSTIQSKDKKKSYHYNLQWYIPSCTFPWFHISIRVMFVSLPTSTSHGMIRIITYLIRWDQKRDSIVPQFQCKGELLWMLIEYRQRIQSCLDPLIWMSCKHTLITTSFFFRSWFVCTTTLVDIDWDESFFQSNKPAYLGIKLVRI